MFRTIKFFISKIVDYVIQGRHQFKRDFIVRNTLKCSLNYCRPNFKQLQFPSYDFMHWWYIIAIFAFCKIRTANLFWRYFSCNWEFENMMFFPLILTFGQAKVMWTDIRKKFIPQCLSILMKNNQNTFIKRGKVRGKSNHIFSIMTVIMSPHVRHENRKDQTNKQTHTSNKSPWGKYTQI